MDRPGRQGHTYGKPAPLARQRTAWLGLLLGGALQAAAAAPLNDLSNLSFEELANLRVTSVSGKSERLADAPAAVFVITREDLRRSGASSLPEALRLAPNVQVAEVSAYGYAISARGLNSSSTNKLLVLIDGRSVYTPLFSGVFWDVQDVPLEEIERIEVISGPGGTMWGTNAVNGVINVITRAAGESQRGEAGVQAGNRQAGASLRYGATTDGDVDYRLYARHVDRHHTSTSAGVAVNDAAYHTQLGFRADWHAAADRYTMQGDAYRGGENQARPGMISLSNVAFALGPISLSGANLNARWERTLDAGARVNVQAYIDRTERTVVPTFAETLDIANIQFQHSLAPSGAHALLWGAGYRYGMDRVVNSPYIAFLPGALNQHWANVFAQDEVLLGEQLRLTVGARVEHNDYTGSELLPSARLAWQFAPAHLLWGALSRTVRAPSRLDHDTYSPGSPPYLLRGGAGVRSELATVLEIGVRAQPSASLSYSLTAYHSRYDHLRTQEIDAGRSYIYFANQMQGSASGIEMWGTWQLARRWRLNGGLTALREHLALKPGSNDLAAPAGTGRDPAHQWTLRSSLDLSASSELDLSLRQVAALSNPAVPAYTSVDLRLGWMPWPAWEGSLTAQHLNGGGHGEFTSLTTRSYFGRSLLFKVLHRF